MKPLLVIVFSIMVYGCTLTPGSHISLPKDQSSFTDGDMRINVYSLSAGMIKQHTLDNTNGQTDLPPAFTVSESKPYTIGIGDVITIVVWDHPELTSPLGQFRNSEEQGNVVYEDGTIFFPYAGNVSVVGKTVSDVRKLITEKLRKFIEAPQVDVRVSGYKSQKYIVTGDIAQPGVYFINNIEQRILDALTVSGAVGNGTNLFGATLTRDNQQYSLPLHKMLYQGDMTYNLPLEDGDVLHVKENKSRKAFVMGEVGRPLAVELSSTPTSLTEALSEAGGINEIKADANHIYVIRQTQHVDELDIFQVSVSQAYHFALADQFNLAERDIVYVTAAPITRWNRFISNVLPSITSIRTLDDIGGTN